MVFINAEALSERDRPDCGRQMRLVHIDTDSQDSANRPYIYERDCGPAIEVHLTV